MKTVQAFIDLGFFIVPLHGVITRDEKTGKKSLPPFPKSWKEVYLDVAYNPKDDKEAVALTGAMICGKRSGAISIDCDNQETYDIFKALDPEYEFAFMSKDKEEGGGSIVYRLTPEYEDLPTFRIKTGMMMLDFQTNDSLQFLPTSGNKTKVEWKGEDMLDLPELKEPPPLVIHYLKTIYDLHTRSERVTTESGALTQNAVLKHYKNLAPFIEAFLKTKKFDANLFRILTPNNDGFKDLPEFKQNGTLHPDEVPDGMGNDYMKSVAGVLTCDNSVSPKLFKKMMNAVNDMWSTPNSIERMRALVKHEVNRKEWSYDEDWQDRMSLILTDYGTLISVSYDPLTKIYYALDNQLGMSTFGAVDTLPKHLNSIVEGTRKYSTMEIYDYLEKKQMLMTPLEPYGDLPPANDSSELQRYNLFQRSKAYSILLNPENYDELYANKTPEVTIAFFEHLIPDKITREYVLGFILTKLVSLEFSEVVLYFLGKMGAGKNLFVDWLDKFTENTAAHSQNADYKMVVEVELENFLAKYNLWIMNALFANLDEYGEKTSGVMEDKRILAQLKSYTGKSQIQLRTMSSDPIPAKHKCTFILTANENRLSLNLDDRRLVLIDTPMALAESEFASDNGGKSAAIDLLFKEQHLWAYYWAINYPLLKKDDYRTPPSTAFKKELILRHLPASKKIAALVYEQNVDMFIELCDSQDMVQELLSDAKYGAVSKGLLVGLFESMTDGTTARKAMLDKSLRELGLKTDKMRFGATRQTYGIGFAGLKKWASKHQMIKGVLLHDDNDET